MRRVAGTPDWVLDLPQDDEPAPCPHTWGIEGFNSADCSCGRHKPFPPPTVQERQELMELAWKGCGKRRAWLFRPADPDQGRPARFRLQVLGCGRRGCPRCQTLIADRASERLKGDWKAMITLTIGPHHLYDLEAEWEAMPRRLSRYTAALKRRLARKLPGVDKSDPRRQYAWVLEAHKDGYPHAHLVISLPLEEGSDEWWGWIRWSQKAWHRILERPKAAADWKYLKDWGDRQTYLVKYLRKQILPPRILALMYRRRLWASTIKAPDLGDVEGWQLLGQVDPGQVQPLLDEPQEWAASHGWRVVRNITDCLVEFEKISDWHETCSVHHSGAVHQNVADPLDTC